jgi:cysteine desulfurase
VSLYLDSNATAPLRPEVREAFLAALERVRGNPSSLHRQGREARHLLDEARERVAAALAVHEEEVVFTSGGTESNNLAVLGALRARPVGEGLAVSASEHSSVLAPARELEREGRPLTVLPVDKTGTVVLAEVERALADPAIALVAVMAANNEIGTCAPFEELRAAFERAPRRPLLHVDAVQALGRIPVRLAEWGADLASFSVHKLGGPVGIGLLYRRRGVALRPLCFGGEQEHGLRPGTENVAGAVAAALAIELAVREQAELAQRLNQGMRQLWGELVKQLGPIQLVGLPLEHPRRLPGTLNLHAPGVDGKVLVMRLDLAGLACSAGSACASGSLEPSHVLLALGHDETVARAALRLSLPRDFGAEMVRKTVESLWTTLGEPHVKRGPSTGL